jgi:predicted anti-sigma-YlaC factor YlaD
MLKESKNIFSKYFLNCSDVTHLASDYLDKNGNATLTVKIRLHLLVCSCCRKFVKHLKITKEIVPQFFYHQQQEVNAESILTKVKEQQKHSP